jgi:hypothetical protein
MAFWTPNAWATSASAGAVTSARKASKCDLAWHCRRGAPSRGTGNKQRHVPQAHRDGTRANLVGTIWRPTIPKSGGPEAATRSPQKVLAHPGPAIESDVWTYHAESCRMTNGGSKRGMFAPARRAATHVGCASREAGLVRRLGAGRTVSCSRVSADGWGRFLPPRG